MPTDRHHLTIARIADSLAGADHPHAHLDAIGRLRVARIRLLGTMSAILMAIGACGAGALPVLQNPAQGERVFGLLLRIQQTSMTLAMIGMVGVTLCWLGLAGHVLGRTLTGRPRNVLDRTELDRIIASWGIPLAIAPPMFSMDVYSYLAQGALAAKLDDPYSLGPVSGLGVAHPLAINVPAIWRDTPNQYGPVFLAVQRGIFELTGDNVLAGLALHRIVAVAGVIAMGWAIPRLARRCGVSDVAALWLGVANPLVLFHLVSGIHSEAPMLGLLSLGLVAVLRATDNLDPWTWKQWSMLVVGTVLVTAAALIKLPVVVALGFIGMSFARRLGGTVVALLKAAALMAAIAAATIGVSMLVTDAGWGWVTKLGAATSLRSWISMPTAYGVIIGGAGQLLGLGDHTEQVLAITQGAGIAAAGLWTVWLLWSTWRGSIHLLGGLGLAMAGIVVLFPVVHPWYLLWALVPLAAWASAWKFRVPVVLYSAFLAVFVLPPGYGPPPHITIGAWIATVCVLAIALLLTLKWPGFLRISRMETALTRHRQKAADGEGLPSKP